MRAGGIEERCLVLALPLLPVLHPAFIHICFTGDLETCPFAPYSDINLNDVTLKEGLGSVFLRTIRENHSMLTESMGGCALWENRDWVASVLEESRTSEE